MCFIWHIYLPVSPEYTIHIPAFCLWFPLLDVLPSISLYPPFKVQLKRPFLYAASSNSAQQRSSFPLVNIHSALSLPALLSSHIVLRFYTFTVLILPYWSPPRCRGHVFQLLCSHPVHTAIAPSHTRCLKKMRARNCWMRFLKNYHFCKMQ